MKNISSFFLVLLLNLLFYRNLSAQVSVSGSLYRADSIMYYNADSTIRFGATLRIPLNRKKYPIAVIVSGTGKQSRDGLMGGHQMFAFVADYLANHGIGVLCTDDRGTGLTTGNYEISTTADFAADVIASVSYLKSRKDIYHKSIGLIGHSEGGAVICIAASQSKDIVWMVSLAGICMKGYDAIIKQNLDIVEAAKIPDYNKKRFNDINALMFATVYANADSANLEQKLRLAHTDWLKKDAEYFKTLNIKYDHFFFPFEGFVKQATSPWYRFFIKYDPVNYLPKVKAPILALNGDKDLMVSYRENLDNWIKYAALGSNNQVESVVLPGVNHLFQHCSTCTTSEYASINETFAPEALTKITQWIQKQYK